MPQHEDREWMDKGMKAMSEAFKNGNIQDFKTVPKTFADFGKGESQHIDDVVKIPWSNKLEKALNNSKTSMLDLKAVIEENKLTDVFESMKRIPEADRSDFFKAYFSELNWRLNDPLNENVVYKEVTDRLNKQ